MSWIQVSPLSHFPIENLPYGIFSRKVVNPISSIPNSHRMGVAIGDYVLDIPSLYHAGLYNNLSFDPTVLLQPTLNSFMSLSKLEWTEFRQTTKNLLDDVATDNRLRENKVLQSYALIPMNEVEMHLPATIGDYTDFYSSREHATNIGIMLRGKDNALQPNWMHLPVGYHGRASSVVISGTDVVRPSGQILADPTDPSKGPIHHPSRALDFELEMAFFVGGSSNPLGRPLTIEEAGDRIFGVVVMNDWSARDVQAWEYVPLGPFTAKNFCTSISPWIVPMDALAAFRCTSSAGEKQEPSPLPYLEDPNYHQGSYDVNLQVSLRGEQDESSSVISESNLKYMYWNFKQQLVHHSVSGCNIRAGDLLATGTISGPTDTSMGSMMELSWKGSREIKLVNSSDPSTAAGVRKYLKDGDTVTMSGFAQGAGYRIGFGEVSGRVLPASAASSLPLSQPTPMVQAASTQPVLRDVKLYSYYNSSSSQRVRIALGLKGVAYEYVAINLKPLAGNITVKLPHELAERNKQEQVPVLEFTAADGNVVDISQSVAIVEFLDEAFPGDSSMLPTTALLRARARQIVEVVNSGVQPLQNLGLTRQIRTVDLIDGSQSSPDDVPALVKYYIVKGLTAIEDIIAASWKTSKAQPGQRFAVGTNYPTVADIFLVPQIYSAKRFNVDLSQYPCCMEVFNLAETIPAFSAAAPHNQPDAI